MIITSTLSLSMEHLMYNMGNDKVEKLDIGFGFVVPSFLSEIRRGSVPPCIDLVLD